MTLGRCGRGFADTPLDAHIWSKTQCRPIELKITMETLLAMADTMAVLAWRENDVTAVWVWLCRHTLDAHI